MIINGLLIASFKVSLVGLIFMHLRHERGLIYKVLLFAMSLPFAVLGNIARVFTIVLASKFFGQAIGTGPWHDISGFIVTIPIAWE